MDSDARDFEIALDDLTDHLAQTQFDVGENEDLRAHGKVVEALEMLVRLYPREAERTLNTAALALLKLRVQSESWLDEIQRIVDAARTLANDGVELSLAATTEIDRLFTQALLAATSSPSGFPKAWQAVLWRSSEHAPLGRLVRWLERGAQQRKGDRRRTSTQRRCGDGNQFHSSRCRKCLAWNRPRLDSRESDAPRST